MTTVGGLTIPITPPLQPQPQDPGPTDGTGDGAGETGGTGEAGGSSETGGNGNGNGSGSGSGSGSGNAGGNGNGNGNGNGGNTGGASGTGETGGSGSSGGPPPSDTSGTSGGGGTTRTDPPSSTGRRAPSYTLDFSKPEETGPGDFTFDGVISETQRLDLAFARVLDSALERRYAEAARLEVISDGLLERLKDGGTTGGAFASDVETLRTSAPSQDDRGLDRTA